MTKYFYKKEDNKQCFLELDPSSLENKYLEINNNIIKYRFLDYMSTEDFTELGYYAYKKILDKTINEI